MFNILLSVYIWFMTVLLTVGIFTGLIFIRASCRHERLERMILAIACWWSDSIIRVNPLWSVKVEGAHHIAGNALRIYVSNHTSMADILVLYKIRKQFKWVAKQSLFSIPFLGWTMTLSKHISLIRDDLGSIRDVNKKIIKLLDEGISVFLFPEGTRSRTGLLQPFKNGAFKMAIQKQVPIVPIAVKHSFDALPRDTWIFSKKADMIVKVFPPIDTRSYQMRDFAKLRDTVYDLIAAEVPSQNDKGQMSNN